MGRVPSRLLIWFITFQKTAQTYPKLQVLIFYEWYAKKVVFLRPVRRGVTAGCLRHFSTMNGTLRSGLFKTRQKRGDYWLSPSRGVTFLHRLAIDLATRSLFDAWHLVKLIPKQAGYMYVRILLAASLHIRNAAEKHSNGEYILWGRACGGNVFVVSSAANETAG